MDEEPAHRGLRRREQIIGAMVQALRRREELVAVVSAANDLPEARRRLMDVFGFDEAQASAVIDMQVRRMTVEELSELERELAEIRAQLHEPEAGHPSAE
jgi:DNA gyrase subunit A